jgi:AcrR family transcriptional regulator
MKTMSPQSPSNNGAITGADAPRRSKEVVKATSLAAAYDLLIEAGISGVSFEEVSRRSGVAKTTIYRYWPTRSALLFDAVMEFAPRLGVPDTGSVQGDLTALALDLAHHLQAGGWSSAMPTIIDAGERDQDAAEFQSRTHAGMISGFSAIAARAQNAGELEASVDISELTAAIVGPIFYRRWFSRQEMDDTFVRGIVERVLRST